MSAAAKPPQQRLLDAIKNGDYALAFGLFSVLVILILPIPKALLDLLLTFSIALSVLTLLVIIYVREPVSFSAFPSLLLIATLYRLSLNVASTRLILIDADAGKIIGAFGQFVVGGNYVVGAVIFLILVIVNFIVITKGAGRIAEVAARFTLDAMPGKQMAIDAELNAGMIDEATARDRRKKIQQEADFYGKMDGASKFVRGDAIAGVLITLINLVGGFAIGMMQRGMSLQDSAKLYSLLSIGDGLVSQIPALILSLAAGLMVTRASENQNLGSSFARQLGLFPRAMGILGAVLIGFGIMPGMPVVPFMTLGITAIVVSILLKRANLDASKYSQLLTDENFDPALQMAIDAGNAASAAGGDASAGGVAGAPGAGQGADAVAAKARAKPEEIQKLVDVDILSIELGYNLLRLADEQRGGDLIDRVTGLRRAFAREMGLVLPQVAVRDNLELDTHEYRFLLRGRPLAKGRLLPNRWLAMNISGSTVVLPGEKTKEPVFGLDAVWVDEKGRKTAEASGYTVVDAVSVLCTHISEVFRNHAYEILDRAMVKAMLDHAKEKNGALVDELVPDHVPMGVLQGVLRALLREGLSVRNFTIILEAIADMAPHTKNVNDLAEFTRRRIAPYVIRQYEYKEGLIKAMTLEPQLEQFLISRVQRSQFETGLSLDPQTAHSMLASITRYMSEMVGLGLPPVLVVMQDLRLALRNFFEPSLPKLVVIAYQEVPNSSELENFGVVSAPLPAKSSAAVPGNA